MLNLEEMQQAWAEHDRKLDQCIRLNQQLLSTANLNGARSALHRLTILIGVEAALWFAIVMGLGNFIYQNFGMPRFAWPGVAVDIYAIGMFAANIGQIFLSQIDYGGPVAVIQKQLGYLRVLRIRTTQWGLLAGVVVWAPLGIVVLRAFFGIQSYDFAWLAANVAFGLALIPLALWLSKKFSHRMSRSPFMQRIMNEIAGHSLNRATAFLSKLSEFES
jgi:hypothetical protein